MPTWSFRPYASVGEKKVSTAYTKKQLTNSHLNYEKPGHPEKDQRSWHWNRTTVLTLTMRPSTRCCPSLSSGLAEMIRKYCALENICHSETPDKERFSRVAKFYKNRRRDSWSRAENVREFSSCAQIRLNDVLFQKCWRQCARMQDFSCLVHIPAMIPATSRSAERSFNALRRLKPYRRSALDNNVSVTLPLLILKGHMPTL